MRALPRAGRGAALTAFAILLLTLVRVASTHRVFSAVLDEPTHIAAGFDYVALGSTLFDRPHPPLARIAAAWPLRHFPPPRSHDMVGRGSELLETADHYEHNLAQARRGNLAFLALALIITWWWAARTFTPWTATIAVGLLASMPPILGHAGVATTDLSVVATLPLALLAFERWLERPGFLRSLTFAVALSLGLLSKFSFIPFFPVCALVLISARFVAGRAILPSPTAPAGGAPAAALAISLLKVSAMVLLLVWAVYRFDVGVIVSDPNSSMARAFADRWIGWFDLKVPVPAPDFWNGMQRVKFHNEVGHLSYLFGRYSLRGFWYYFPVVFFYKTPIPFLLLAVWGAYAAIRVRQGLELVAMPFALMLVVMPSAINIGVRHILPLYPPLCIIAAFGAVATWQSRNAVARGGAVLLVLWLIVGTGMAHPNYIAWFNEAAGKHPETIAADSNLDWGQDVLPLCNYARHHGIDNVAFLCVSTIDTARHGLHAHPLQPFNLTTGWIAVSETALVLDDDARKGAYRWLDRYQPVVRIGGTIRLYHVPQ
jgi:hypothetical protein